MNHNRWSMVFYLPKPYRQFLKCGGRFQFSYFNSPQTSIPTFNKHLTKSFADIGVIKCKMKDFPLPITTTFWSELLVQVVDCVWSEDGCFDVSSVGITRLWKWLLDILIPVGLDCLGVTMTWYAIFNPKHICFRVFGLYVYYTTSCNELILIRPFSVHSSFANDPKNDEWGLFYYS